MFSFWSVRISVLALVVVALGPLLAHLHVVPPMRGFLLFGIGALVGLVGIVAGMVRFVRGGARPGILAIALGMLAMAIVLMPALLAGRVARINDVSTDLEDPPALTRAESGGRSLEYPAAFVPIARESYKELKPLTLTEPPEQVFGRVEALARSQPGWTVAACDVKTLTCEGHALSRVFRFRDDFAIRVRPDEGGGSVVDMRSRSRDGKGDFGVNAARIRYFLGKLQGEQAPQAAGR